MKPYPNARNYESDVDYYLDCINYSKGNVKAHFDEAITKKIYDFYREIEEMLSVYECADEDADLASSSIIDHLYEAYESAQSCEPDKLLEL